MYLNICIMHNIVFEFVRDFSEQKWSEAIDEKRRNWNMALITLERIAQKEHMIAVKMSARRISLCVFGRSSHIITNWC